jgi:small-conductance mechanosensitive channel
LTRLLPALFALLLLLPPIPATAQSMAARLAATQPAATPAAAPSDSADIDALVRILQNDQARAALIARLKAAAPEPAQAAAPPPSHGFAGGIAEYTRGAAEEVLVGLESAGAVLAGIVAVLRGAATFDLGLVWGAILEVVALIGVTFTVYLALRWAAQRFGAGCNARAAKIGPGAHGRIRRIALLLTAQAADALAVLLAWGAGFGFALSFGAFSIGAFSLANAGFAPAGRISFSQSLFLNAFLFVELIKVTLRLLAVPGRPALRQVPLDDTDAAYWYFWCSRLASLLGYGLLFAAPLVLSSGAWAAAQSIRILTMFTATAIVVAVVLQNRDRVRVALARRLNAGHADAIGRVGAWLGTVWHLIAIVYALAVFVVWLANPGNALAFMLQATLQSLVAGGLGIAAGAMISRFISSGLHVPQDVRDRLPLLETRLNAFVPAVLRVVRLVVLVCVLATVAQVWGLLNFAGWLSTDSGRQITGAIVSAALILLVGGVLHVAFASWVEYRLNPNFGSVPTARERTLLALFRNAFTIALIIVVTMLALSQIGVNIAPLLAGAGVLGLAIGFGAQKLVQDIITGIFIQFENAMNEGEVVNAGGVGGVVERLTIRSVSIRDLNGVLHIIPFSTVDKVSNLMRHFSYHVAEIGVAYRENIAEVKEAMQEAFALLQRTDHGPNILGELDMHGITAFGDSAITVRARIKTLPGKHWAAGRAYNEIIKEIFDARGIEIPFPHVTLYMGEDKQGNAPALRLRGERRHPAKAPAEPVTLPEKSAPVAEEEGEKPSK